MNTNKQFKKILFGNKIKQLEKILFGIKIIREQYDQKILLRYSDITDIKKVCAVRETVIELCNINMEHVCFELLVNRVSWVTLIYN